jgi:hypothetical protein
VTQVFAFLRGPTPLAGDGSRVLRGVAKERDLERWPIFSGLRVLVEAFVDRDEVATHAWTRRWWMLPAVAVSMIAAAGVA